MADPLKPSLPLLVKLGSLAVHAREYFSPHGHPFDRTEIETRLADSELADWLAEMQALSFLPLERNPATVGGEPVPPQEPARARRKVKSSRKAQSTRKPRS